MDLLRKARANRLRALRILRAQERNLFLGAGRPLRPGPFILPCPVEIVS